MAAYTIICAIIFTTCSIAISATQEKEDFQITNTEPRPIGRAYSFVGCNYRFQAGYTCLSCHRALHCYPGNAAILVDCYGLFRYCRDGRCSRREGEKCPDTGDMSAVMIVNNTLAAVSPEVAAQAAAAELQAAEAAQAAAAQAATAELQAAQAVAAQAAAAELQAPGAAQAAEVAHTAVVLEAASEVSRDTIVTEATTKMFQNAEVLQTIYAASATTEVLQAAEFAQATEVSRPPFDPRDARRPEASTTKRYEKLNEVV